MTLKDIDVTGYDTILLDRDGTINRQRVGDYVKMWSEFEFLPGVLEAIARFAKTTKHIFIVTNQRGVGRGRMSEIDLNDIHTRMVEEISKSGGRIDGIYYATGVDDTDNCRKPNTGMWDRIKNDYPEVSEAKTLMIGDGECDKEFAENCGISFQLVDKSNVIFVRENTI